MVQRFWLLLTRSSPERTYWRAYQLNSCLTWEYDWISEQRECGSYSAAFFFNWRIIALQYCLGFCHTSTWISYRYTYVPSLLNLPSTPLGCHRAPGLSSQQIPTSYLFYIQWCVCFNVTLSICPTSPSPTVSPSLFFMSASPLLPCKWIIRTIFLDPIYLC